jgi:hypothetical protein
MSGQLTGRRILASSAGCLGLLLLAALVALMLLGLRGQAGAAPPLAVTAPALTEVATPGGDARTPAATSPSTVALALREHFDRPADSGFAIRDDEVARYAFEQGGYTITVKAPETVVWTLAGGRYNNVAVSVDAAVPPGYGRAAAGVIFHYQDDSNFYLFQVSSAGYYALELVAADQLTTLIDWTQSDAIDGAANLLGVETSGDRIALYVNGRRLEETRDTSFTHGDVGIAASSFVETDAAIRFDNLTILTRHSSLGYDAP